MLSALVLQTPRLVSLATRLNSNQNNRVIGSQELAAIGGNLYAIVMDLATSFLHVYKSTNGGFSWTEKDAAHAPYGGTYQAIVAQDGIYTVRSDILSNESLWYARFDPATDTWGPSIESTRNINVGAFQNIVRRSNGDIVVLYQAENTFGDVHWGIFSHAGAWTGENIFNSTTQETIPVAAVIGPDDTVHVVIQDLLGPFNFYYQRLSPTNVVSAPVLIATQAIEFLSGLPLVLNNQIIFPFGQYSLESNPQMFVGTPANAPVWSAIPLNSVGGGGSNTIFPAAFSNGGTLFMFQTLTTGAAYQIWYVPFHTGALGAPGTPVLFYDAIANPPAGGPIQEILKVVPIAGSILAVIDMELTPGFPPENTYFLRGGCPPNAQGV